MQALKTLVVVMGVLIVLTMGVIGYGLMKKAEDPGFTFFRSSAPAVPDVVAPPPAAARPSAEIGPFGDIALGLGAECRIEDAQLAGRKLVVRVGPAGPCERVSLVDLDQGRVLGSVRAR